MKKQKRWETINKSQISTNKSINQIIQIILENRGIKTTEEVEADCIDYIFCSDDYLLEINRNTLNHDYYTDIITFDLTPSKKGPIQSEIYISIDRVRDNAHTHGSSFNRELHRVIFHGLLHLLGYKDKTPKDEKIMRMMEDQFIALYFG